MSGQTKASLALQSFIQEKTKEIATQAYNLGYADGLETGKIIGYVQGVNDLKPALSDGLRHGSSECGKAMQSLTNLGAYANPEDSEAYEYEIIFDEEDN